MFVRKPYCMNQKKKKNSLENNSLIYTYKNNQHELYVINSIVNENEYLCNRQGKFLFKSSLLPNYDWKSVGVYRKGPIGDESYTISRNEIKGKVINVLDMLMTCPINVLNEK